MAERERLDNSTGGHHRAFQKDAEFEPCVVTSPLPIDPAAPRILATARPFSQTSDQIETPVFLIPGFTRNFRTGMTSALQYADGSPQAASLFGHSYNLDAPFSVYGDPMPSDASGTLLNVNPDDMVIHHDETGSFMRWRNINSTPTTAAADGSPCAFEATWLSQLHIKITEYVPPGSPPNPPTTPNGLAAVPPPPTRAKFEIDMPQGATLVVDEPADGQSTLTYTHPTGAVLSCDAEGTWKIASPASSPPFELVLSKAAQQAKVSTAAGFYTLYDDAGRAISHVSPGGLETVTSDATDEISHIAPNIGLGALVSNLDPTNSPALNHGHLSTFESSLFTKRLDDLSKFATAMTLANVPNAPGVLAQLATLLHIPVPSGSSIVKIG